MTERWTLLVHSGDTPWLHGNFGSFEEAREAGDTLFPKKVWSVEEIPPMPSM